jgi:hypothetical protein
LKTAEELVDKAILHADKLFSSSTAEEQVVLKEVAAANAELEEASSSLRKHSEKDENLRGSKRKIDCDLPVQVDVITSEIVSEEKKEAEAVERELLQQRISQTLARKARSSSKLSEIIEKKYVHKSTLTRLYMQRIHTNVTDSKKFSLIPGISQSLRVRCLVQLQCITSGCVDAKDIHSVFASLIKDLTPSTALPLSTSTLNTPLKEFPNVAGSSLISDAQRLETLLDVSRVAHQMSYTKFAQISFDLALKINCPKSAVMRIKIDLTRALQILAYNGTGE